MIPSRSDWGVAPVRRFPVRPGTPVVHSTAPPCNFTRSVTMAGPPVRVDPVTGSGPAGLVGARTGKALFSHRYGPMFAQALAAETRDDLAYRPYRADTTGLVPPVPAEPFEPGCDRCGAHPAGYAIDLDSTLHLLCTTHMVRWDHENTLARSDRYRRTQEQALIDAYRRWGL